MPVLNFRTKLVLAMSLTVLLMSATTLYVSQGRVEAAYQAQFEEQFRLHLTIFSERRMQKRGEVARRCQRVAESVRLISALEEALIEDDPELVYDNLDTEIGPLTEVVEEVFLGVIDPMGRVLRPGVERSYLIGFEGGKGERSELGKMVERLSSGGHTKQEVGFLAMGDADGQVVLREIILTPLVNLGTGDVLGALAAALPAAVNPDERGKGQAEGEEPLQSGIWLEGRLFSPTIREALEPAIARLINDLAPLESKANVLAVDGVPHLFFQRALNPGSMFPPAVQVGLYSMAEAVAAKRELRLQILSFSAVTMVLGLLAIRSLSRGFSRPIEQLALATRRIASGDFTVRVPARGRDELAMLAGSFNDMAEDLALKERYKAVLAQVTDASVAEQLIHGGVALGGEVRRASVLFCDIRGFTALTENMPPKEVIAMMNEHMTAMTRIVHAHHGVVDKFVGDLIMAIFGAPKIYGDDAQLAVQCGLEMLSKRKEMNEAAGKRIEMGIGIATGEMVAGCMGSDDRLNYTVLGERVNLASRLCSKAGVAELLIDELTHEELASSVKAEPLELMSLKGFRRSVQAYRVQTESVRREATAASNPPPCP